MEIELLMAWPRRHQSIRLELPEGATLAQALEQAGWNTVEAVQGYAIFGATASASSVLRQGDRVELLRPLQADPKDARRRRASRPAR